MPHGHVSDVIPAPAAEVFELLHNYDRRLEWDTLLQAAYLLDGCREAGLGARSVCKGKKSLGGIALTTEYISFRRPEVAAVQMLNRPPFFDTFAATIRHKEQPDGTSTIEYNYNFTSRPRWLQFVLHPVMNFCFKMETKKRLAASPAFFETAEEFLSKAHMSAEMTSKRPLTQLNFEIEEAEAEQNRLDADRAAIGRMVSQASRRMQYLRLAGWARKPTKEFELWPIVLLTVGSGFVAVAAFILTHLVFNSVSTAFLGLLIGLAGGAALFALLLYKPPNALLPATLAEADSHLRLLQARQKEKVERITETKTRLNRLLEERRDQIASGKLQKAALLQRKWKTMQETEWQDFVVEVCRTLDAKVERIGRPGGEDANLIADFGSRRVAIMTEAKDHNVTSATIQLALAAKNRHHCDSCAVIINRRFTGASQDFARHNGCAAIGTGEFPDFVMGKIEL